MTRTTTTRLILATLAATALAACADQITTEPDPGLPTGNATGGEGNTFDHPDTQVDVWALLDRLQQQGPPKYTSRVHSCPKMKYETIGRVLASRGVDINANGETTAGQMWRDSDQALGVANYAARQRENLELIEVRREIEDLTRAAWRGGDAQLVDGRRVDQRGLCPGPPD